MIEARAHAIEQRGLCAVAGAMVTWPPSPARSRHRSPTDEPAHTKPGAGAEDADGGS